MLDAPTENTLQVTLCGSDAAAEALKAAGLRSVKVITSPEQVCTAGRDGQPVVHSSLAAYGRFVLAFGAADSDLRDAIAMRLGDTRCRWVRWPQGVEGPYDLEARHGAEALAQVLRTETVPMWQDEVCILSDVPDEAPQQGFITGFENLDNSKDRFFRLTRPAFMPVIGPYGSGKSVLLRQLACNLWRLHGWRTLITAFEEKIKPRYVRDLRRHIIAANRMDARANDGVIFSKDQTWEASEVREADEQIDAGFRFLRRKRGALLDSERLVDRIAYAVEVYGVDVVMIDPVNEVDHIVPRGMSKTDYMGHFIMQLKQLADDYNLLMIVAAHPPKAEAAGRAKKIYTLNDGADTAHYGNKADIGWCVWRPGGSGPTYLNIDKCKDHDVMGQPTLARLAFAAGGFTVADIGDHVIEQILGNEQE